MKGRTLSILGIFAAVVGVILILCYNSIKVSGVTITCGILFVGVGLVNLLIMSSNSKNESATTRVLTLIANAAAIVLGISMLVFQSTFSPLIAFMFGLLVATCSLWQFFTLAIGTRPYQLPVWLFVFPVLLGAAAIYLFVRKPIPNAEDSLLMLTTGISMAILGVGCIIEGSVLGIARRNYEKANADAALRPQPSQATVSQHDAQKEASEPESVKDQPKKQVETTDDLDDEIKHDTYE